MSAGFDRIGLGRFAGTGERLARAVTIASVSFGRGLLWLLAAIIVGCGIWMLLPVSRGNSAEPVRSDVAAVETAPSRDAVAVSPASEAQIPTMAELGRIRISSQTWRRGGLGSKALATLTLRNDNDYAVKDVEIVCAFARRDGSHLTDRTPRSGGSGQHEEPQDFCAHSCRLRQRECRSGEVFACGSTPDLRPAVPGSGKVTVLGVGRKTWRRHLNRTAGPGTN